MKTKYRKWFLFMGGIALSVNLGCGGSHSSPSFPGIPPGKGGGGASTPQQQMWISDRLDDRRAQQIVVHQDGDQFTGHLVTPRLSSSKHEDLIEGYTITETTDGTLQISGLDPSQSDVSARELYLVDEHQWSPSLSGSFSRYAVAFQNDQGVEQQGTLQVSTTRRPEFNSFVWESVSKSRNLSEHIYSSDEMWPNSGFDETDTTHKNRLEMCSDVEFIEVPAGFFKTCKVVESERLTIWYGNVRSGIVRLEFLAEDGGDHWGSGTDLPIDDSFARLYNKSQIWELEAFGH